MSYFAPRGFATRIERAEGCEHHPFHDKFYLGATATVNSINGGYEMADLTSFLKSKFEPAVADLLAPMPNIVRDLRLHLKKSTGKIKNHDHDK